MPDRAGWGDKSGRVPLGLGIWVTELLQQFGLYAVFWFQDNCVFGNNRQAGQKAG